MADVKVSALTQLATAPASGDTLYIIDGGTVGVGGTDKIITVDDLTSYYDSATATLTNKTIDADGTGNSITNIEDANIKSGAAIDAAKIHDGTISNTEFGYLNGVTSAIQTQLNAKAPTASPSFTGTVTLPTGLTGVIRADSGVVSVDSDVTDIVTAATSSAAGKVELATGAETTTGTDTDRAVTPDGLAASDYGKRVVTLLPFDDSEDVATGDGAGDLFYRVPSVLNGYNLVAVAASVQTAGTTGTTDIQIHNVTDTADMLSTKITIDSAETDSSTAATAAVINSATDDVATGDSLRIDVDAVSTTAPKGLLVELTFQLP